MPKLPQSIGSFKVLESLGRGGTSQVYKALHPNLKKTVVLKKLTLRGAGPVKERFQREAELMMGFNHHHIVKVFDIFKEGSSWIIVQEFVDGPNLEELIDRKGALGKKESLAVIVQCLKALIYIHKKGVVHRDIKPSNIFLTSRGLVKLGDFGIASRLAGESGGLTREGAALGTPDFMAPEQALNPSDVDGRSDLYALALTWYEAWTGLRWPRKGRSRDTRLSREVRFSLVGAMLRKCARKRRSFRPVSARSLLIQIRLFLFPLLISRGTFDYKTAPKATRGRKKDPVRKKSGIQKKTPLSTGDKGKRRTRPPVPVLLLVLAVPLILWGGGFLYFGVINDSLYGRFQVEIPYEEGAASWYLDAVKVRLYRSFQGKLRREKSFPLFNRRKNLVLLSPGRYLKTGNYQVRLSLPDREEWQTLMVSPGKNTYSPGALEHPEEPLALNARIFDLLSGETLSQAKIRLISRGEILPLEGPLPILPGRESLIHISCPGYADLIQPLNPRPRQREVQLSLGLLPLPARIIIKRAGLPDDPGWNSPVKVDGSANYLRWGEEPRWERIRLGDTGETELFLAPGEHILELRLSPEETKDVKVNLASEEVKTFWLE